MPLEEKSDEMKFSTRFLGITFRITRVVEHFL
jgi:hypothetical protein